MARESWPKELNHSETCRWRFGGPCDCKLSDGPAPLKAGDTIAARIDGAAVTLTTEERQYVEPAMYAWEAGWWCVSGKDDWLYFVSDDGRIDRHDAEDFKCVEESVGVTEAAWEGYWNEEAAAEYRRTFPT